MSAPDVQRTRYWVFDEQQLTDALAEWQQRDDSEEARHERGAVRGFLNSGPCIRRGMRRGGED